MPSPRKRFGQHFLCDQNVISKIISLINPSAQDHLVEIGPGQGAITLPLLKKVKKLQVIELDRDLITPLQERTKFAGVLEIFSEDALNFDFSQLKQDDRLLRVVGNLPYNISTPLLFHLLEYTPIIHDMIFMLQKEVAERLAAKVNSEHYGRLSIMIQYHCQVDLLCDVSRQAFYPPPQVTSSMVKLIPHHTLPFKANDYTCFASVVRQAFSQRRKTLHNSLKTLVKDDIWQQVSINPTLRPENLAVKDYVAISNALG